MYLPTVKYKIIFYLLSHLQPDCTSRIKVINKATRGVKISFSLYAKKSKQNHLSQISYEAMTKLACNSN